MLKYGLLAGGAVLLLGVPAAYATAQANSNPLVINGVVITGDMLGKKATTVKEVATKVESGAITPTAPAPVEQQVAQLDEAISQSVFEQAKEMFGNAWTFALKTVGDTINLMATQFNSTVGVSFAAVQEGVADLISAAKELLQPEIDETEELPEQNGGLTSGSNVLPPVSEASPEPVERPAFELPALQATVFEVHNRAELAAALKSALATGPADILVHPGSYGEFVYSKKKHVKGQVRLMAATAERPHFSHLNLSSSSGILIQGMEFSSDTKVLIYLNKGEDIVLVDNLLTGATRDKNPWNDNGSGIHVRWAKNVTLSDNLFEDLRVAIYFQQSDDVVAQYNKLHYMREGINVAATNNLTLQGNSFSHFYPNYGRGEHPDAIQFWTRVETTGSSNVKILENAFIFGGKRAVQGVFIGAENAYRYSNFEIAGNIYYGSSLHGISMTNMDGAKIYSNTVVSSPHADVYNSVRSADGTESGGYYPRIRAGSSTDLEIWNNVGMTHMNPDGANSYNNIDIEDDRWGGVKWTDVLVARPTAEHPALSEFLTKPGTDAYAKKAGAMKLISVGVRPLNARNFVATAMDAHRK